jgi:outer membrane lipoprotein-sorting protein
VDGPDGYTLTFDGFEDVRGSPFPRTITFAGAGQMALQYTDLRLGEQPDPSVFAPEPPPGVPVEQMGSVP